jgi:hypothetical protein
MAVNSNHLMQLLARGDFISYDLLLVVGHQLVTCSADVKNNVAWLTLPFRVFTAHQNFVQY